MAAYNKFNHFVELLANKQADVFGTTPGTDCDVLKVALVRSADPPVATDTDLDTDLTQPTGTGYTAGGEVIGGQSGTRTTGTFTLAGNQIVWTAGAGDWQTFRYVVAHDSTLGNFLIAWWDYGSDLQLGNGETFTWKPNNQASGGTIFTLA